MENTKINQEDIMNDEIDLGSLLGDFLRMAIRFWWIWVTLIIAGTVGFSAYIYAGYRPLYRSSATFTVGTGSESGSYSFYYSKSTADQLSKTFPYILNSSYFRSVLLDYMETDSLNGTLTAETLENSNMVMITVESSSAEDAKTILDAALTVYPDTARFVLGDIQFHLLDEAKQASVPYNEPVLWKTAAKGAAAGGVAAVIILGILALFSKTAKTPDEMKRITNLRCLSAIPMVKQKARKSNQNTEISILNERMPYGFRESIRSLQIRVEREMRRQKAKVLLITSTVAGEGKSTLAENLAEGLAAKGKKVLLLDADLRKAESRRFSKESQKNGADLVSVVKRRAALEEAVLFVENKNYWYLGNKNAVAKPAGILSDTGFAEIVKGFKSSKEYDYVIIDTPPCGMFQDAAILGRYADEILYVVKYDFVSQQKIMEGLSFLQDGNSKFLGYVFNSYPQNMGDYGYGRYGYGHYGYGQYGYGSKKGYGYGYDEKTGEENRVEEKSGAGKSSVRDSGERISGVRDSSERESSVRDSDERKSGVRNSGERNGGFKNISARNGGAEKGRSQQGEIDQEDKEML